MPIKYKNYPDNWLDEIRPDILRRDKGKCKFCGIKNRSIGYRDNSDMFVHCDEFMVDWAQRNGVKVIKIVLSVAHLDQDVKNNEYTNLAALCQRCHLRYDHPYKMKGRRQLKLFDIKKAK